MSRTENFETRIFEIHTFISRDDGSAGEDSDIFHNFFTTVTEGWSFEDQCIEDAFEFIEDKYAESFAFDFFGNDNEIFATGLSHFLEEWYDVVDGGNFFVCNEDFWLIEGGFLAVSISYKEGGCEAFVISVTFGNFGLHFEALPLLYGNDAVFADFLNYISNEFANFSIACGDCGDFGNLLIIAIDFFSSFVDTLDNFGASGFNAFAEIHWVMTGSNKLISFGDNIVSKYGYCSCSVAGNLIKFLSSGFN